MGKDNNKKNSNNLLLVFRLRKQFRVQAHQKNYEKFPDIYFLHFYISNIRKHPQLFISFSALYILYNLLYTSLKKVLTTIFIKI